MTRFAHIRERLAAYDAVRVADAHITRAAVAMVLRETDGDMDVLLIQRATRDHDPWSGHVALPGGHQEPGDPDLVHTALRETREEVGIDLHTHGEVIGRLDEMRAMARLRPVDLVICPFVWALNTPAEPVPDVTEVERAVWAPLSHLRSATARAVYRRSHDGYDADFPAYRFQDYTIWGLTYRILERFFELV